MEEIYTKRELERLGATFSGNNRPMAQLYSSADGLIANVSFFEMIDDIHFKYSHTITVRTEKCLREAGFF